MTPRPRVLITGASGLVGSHAAARFQEEGWAVRALVRADSDVRFLEELGTELVLADVTRPDTLSGAAEDCRAVIHAAAHLGGAAPWERYREVNVEGTRHVLTEAVRAGCRRFVHVSSVAVYGDPSRQELPIDEASPVDTPLGPRDHYERSKRMAERAVRRAAEGMVEWTVLRPAVVTGERDRHFAPRVAELTDRSLLVTVGDGGNRLPLVYAGNVAEACLLAATREEAAGRVYNLTFDGGITQRRLVEMTAPTGATVLPLPRAPVELAARLADGLASLAGGGDSRVWNARRVWFLSRPDPFLSRRISRELGWHASVTTVEGWRRTLRWLRGPEAPAARRSRSAP